jgi:hypothetical protein
MRGRSYATSLTREDAKRLFLSCAVFPRLDRPLIELSSIIPGSGKKVPW